MLNALQEAAKEQAWQVLAGVAKQALDALWGGMGTILPTLALLGVIWWMVPLFPKHEKGLKLTGTSMLIYLFWALLRVTA